MHEIFKEVAAIYLKDGIEKIKYKDWEGALIDLDKALNLDSTLLEAQFYIGMAKSKLDRTEEAMADFNKVLNINPNHVAALINMSYCLSYLKREDEALIFMTKVIEISPDWYNYMQRAAINKSLGNIEGAKLDEDAAWEMGHDFSVF